MEIGDVCAATGRVVRICTDADDLEALRALIEQQARLAQALADEAMRDGWERPVPPVRVEAIGAE